MSERRIRDFIYLNVPRLYSMYSQLEGGVAPPGGDARAEQVAHDRLYDKLEGGLAAALTDAATVDAPRAAATFTERPLVKVSGTAEIEDYERMIGFFDNYNKLGAAFAYAELAEPRKVLQAELDKPDLDKAMRKEIERRLHDLNNPERLAEKLGFTTEAKLLGNLRMFASMFNPEGYEILVTSPRHADVRYRAAIDKQWLRYAPQLLRTLYGGRSMAPWTLVGEVTLVPGGEGPGEPAEDAAPREHKSASLRDPFREMIRTARGIERMFFASNVGVEVLVAPLAIYREFALAK